MDALRFAVAFILLVLVSSVAAVGSPVSLRSAAAASGIGKQSLGALLRAHSPPVKRTLQVTPAIQSLAPGDVIVGGYLMDDRSTTFKLYIINGSTLTITGDMADVLAPACGPAYAQFIPGGFAFTPDNSGLTVVCYNYASTQDDAQWYTLATINTQNLTAQAARGPQAVYGTGAAALYTTAGNLLVGGIEYTPESAEDAAGWDSVYTFDNTLTNLTAIVNMSTPATVDGITDLGLTASSSNLLFATITPTIGNYDVSANRLDSRFIPMPNSTCSSLAPLFDGTVILGCAGLPDGLCAYHVDGQGRILKRFCVPVAAPASYTGEGAVGLVSVAVDVDRTSLVLAMLDVTAAANLGYTNLYRLRMSDFIQIANNSVPAFLGGDISIFGAVPANQQQCGAGKCCTQEGTFAKGTVCKASRDPCTQDAMCSGEAASCPRAETAENGCLCSFDPYGIFSAAGDKHTTAEEAEDLGYHKCGKCSLGRCIRPQSGGKRGHKGHRNLLEEQYYRSAGGYGRRHGGSKHNSGLSYCK